MCVCNFIAKIHIDYQMSALKKIWHALTANFPQILLELGAMRLTVPLDVVVDEIARVSALVGPSEPAISVFATLYVCALVRSTIRPGL